MDKTRMEMARATNYGEAKAAYDKLQRQHVALDSLKDALGRM